LFSSELGAPVFLLLFISFNNKENLFFLPTTKEANFRNPRLLTGAKNRLIHHFPSFFFYSFLLGGVEKKRLSLLLLTARTYRYIYKRNYGAKNFAEGSICNETRRDGSYLLSLPFPDGFSVFPVSYVLSRCNQRKKRFLFLEWGIIILFKTTDLNFTSDAVNTKSLFFYHNKNKRKRKLTKYPNRFRRHPKESIKRPVMINCIYKFKIKSSYS